MCVHLCSCPRQDLTPSVCVHAFVCVCVLSHSSKCAAGIPGHLREQREADRWTKENVGQEYRLPEKRVGEKGISESWRAVWDTNQWNMFDIKYDGHNKECMEWTWQLKQNLNTSVWCVIMLFQLHAAMTEMEQEKFELQKKHTENIQTLLDDTSDRLAKMETEYNARSQATVSTWVLYVLRKLWQWKK